MLFLYQLTQVTLINWSLEESENKNVSRIWLAYPFASITGSHDGKTWSNLRIDFSFQT